MTMMERREDIKQWEGKNSPPVLRKRRSGSKTLDLVSKLFRRSKQASIDKKPMKEMLISLSDRNEVLDEFLANDMQAQNFNLETVSWLITWAVKYFNTNQEGEKTDSDKLGEISTYILARVAFPKEAISGLRTLLFTANVIPLIIRLCTERDVLLCRHIDREDLVIEELISRGAGGVIFKGTWFGIPVAIKSFCDEKNNWIVSRKDFRNEISLTSIFGTFKYFMPILGGNTKEGFFVTPLAQRGSLYHLFEDGTLPSLSWTKKTRMISSIAHSLRSLHSSGILHRDLKPQNIIVDSEYRCYLTDFGISRTVQNTRKRSHTLNIGTTPYMAPEVLQGNGSYDSSIDVFGFGILVWQMVTNCANPYAEQLTAFEIPKFVIDGGRLTIPADCPAYLSSLIADCWNQDPKKRPSFDDVINLLSVHLPPDLPDYLPQELSD